MLVKLNPALYSCDVIDGLGCRDLQHDRLSTEKKRHVAYNRIYDTSYIIYLLYTTWHEMLCIVGLLPSIWIVEGRILSYSKSQFVKLPWLN